MNDFKQYREVIRSTRTQLGISQNKLSKLVQISQPFMAEIESGRKSPSVEVLERICEQLNIEVVFAEGAQDKILVQRIIGLSEEQKVKAVRLLEGL